MLVVTLAFQCWTFPSRIKLGMGCSSFLRIQFVGAQGQGRNVMSLHHGARVRKGSKIVVQLMLDWTGLGSDLGEGEGRDMAASITTRIKNGTEGGGMS